MNYLFLSLAILATRLFYIVGMKYWNDSSPWRFVYSVFPGAKGFRTVVALRDRSDAADGYSLHFCNASGAAENL
jgi:hypothetical protein